MPKLISRSPTSEFYRTFLPRPREVPEGLEGYLHSLIGLWKRRSGVIFDWKRVADKVMARREGLRNVAEDELRELTREAREAFRRPSQVRMAHRIEGLALAAENANRRLGLDPYPVQIMGAWGLLNGHLVEMATGEGKTLTIGLAAAVAAWNGRPLHIVTANDYLAERDAHQMEALYRACGLRTGFVVGRYQREERKEHYARSVVYTTSKELVADFLRDRLALGDNHDASRRILKELLTPGSQYYPEVVQSGIHTVFVDEADYILIDEATTPLIISQPKENENLMAAAKGADRFVADLVEGTDYTLNPLYQEVSLTKAGEARCDEWEPGNIPVLRNPRWRRQMVIQGIKARVYYKKDRNYVVRDGKIHIVDEGTGRIMPNRSWRQGLHQAIEAKEGVELTNPAETMTAISFQRFFRLVPQLAGVTGTARENAAEIWRVYGLPVIALPTHRPCQRRVMPEKVYADNEAKNIGLEELVHRLHDDGLPILVGTRSVKSSGEVAERIRGLNLPYELLNAVNHEMEARIVENAGVPHALTIATNMAGRGTDIKLSQGIAERGGLQVIATERHEAKRVDRQLYGRCARQGDPGCVWQVTCLDDDLPRRFLPDGVRNGLKHAMAARVPFAHWMAKMSIRWCQKKAARTHFQSRLQVMKRDRWVSDSLSFSAGGKGF